MVIPLIYQKGLENQLVKMQCSKLLATIPLRVYTEWQLLRNGLGEEDFIGRLKSWNLSLFRDRTAMLLLHI
jgi:hypothetical protein